MKRHAVPALALTAALAAAALAATAEEHGFDAAGLQSSFMSGLRGWWQAPAVPGDVRALPADQHAAVVRALGTWAKEYVASKQFEKDYAEMRKNASGGRRGFGLPSVGALKQKAVEALKDKAAGPPGAAEATLEKNPRAQVRRQLQAFLDLTADVDFAATTHASGGLRIFDDARYEGKPPVWKMCYRAGRPATEAARAFAEEWLKELP